MGKNFSQKNGYKIILIVFLLSLVLMIATTPIHEAVHWVISDIDPYSKPVEFHIFNDKSLNRGENILSSYLGYITIQEAYPGSFNDRPFWLDPVQEIICIFIQVVITVVVILKVMDYLISKELCVYKQQKSRVSLT